MMLYHQIHKMLMIQMSKHVSIMIDEELDKKLRHIQAKRVKEELFSCSYSQVLNEALRKVLK